jgi:hypothetical protein
MSEFQNKLSFMSVCFTLSYNFVIIRKNEYQVITLLVNTQVISRSVKGIRLLFLLKF